MQAAGQAQTLANALTEAGLPTLIYPDCHTMKWSKLLLNLINNATAAILDEPPIQIIARPDLFNLEIAALREAYSVMRARGLRPVKLPGYPTQWLGRLLGATWLPLGMVRAIMRPFMVSGRGNKMPSLQLDLAAGRRTSEIMFLNGAVVQAGRKVGIATPVNQALTTILSGIVSGELRWADYQHQPEKLLAAVQANTTMN
jgi:2-dehydropantoate 2-reductase